MKSISGDVLYIGKAKQLKNRLSTYVGPSKNREPKIQGLLSLVDELDYIVTESESEALILECTLIKRHKPKYNARLKDDRSYPYIKITNNEAFPQVYITRQTEADGALYFGPYANAGSVRKTLNILNKLFPYRSCTKLIDGKDSKACLEYYINRCIAPCISASTQKEYRNVIDRVIMFMDGKTDDIVRELKNEMEHAASSLNFERAGTLRDQLKAIQDINQKQKVVSLKNENYDALGIAQNETTTRVAILFIRNGKLIGQEQFSMIGMQGEKPDQLLLDFVSQYYTVSAQPPSEILLPVDIEDKDVLTDMLRTRKQKTVRISVPMRGRKRDLTQMAIDNAQIGLEKAKFKEIYNKDSLHLAMKGLQEAVGLPTLPTRIECYDISNIQGHVPVGSMVVFENGFPKKEHYRKFNIETVDGIDDYSMMKEMLRRRFVYLTNDSFGDKIYRNVAGFSSWNMKPDFVVIDGGRGHLNAAIEVLSELKLQNINLASLAKENEEIFIQSQPSPILLNRNSAPLFLIQRLRDEAHRFAITHHRKRRNKIGIMSALNRIPGIGSKKRNLILNHFGSVQKIREASAEEITNVRGVSKDLAKKIMELI
jgi:excinuclease ABC subunit C